MRSALGLRAAAALFVAAAPRSNSCVSRDMILLHENARTRCATHSTSTFRFALDDDDAAPVDDDDPAGPAAFVGEVGAPLAAPARALRMVYKCREMIVAGVIN